MREFLRVSVSSTSAKRKVAPPALAAFGERGWEVRQPYGDGQWVVLVPMNDRGWRKKLAAAERRGEIEAGWSADTVEQRYDEEDKRAAPMFRLYHTGRHIPFATGGDKVAGIHHVGDFDASGCCGVCGAGVEQVSDLRLPRGELNKSGVMASVWIHNHIFLLFADDLLQRLERAAGEELPKRLVELVGRGRGGLRWWQLSPPEPQRRGALKASAMAVHRAKATPCRGCGRVILKNAETPYGVFFTFKKKPDRVPVAAWAPFWGGKLERRGDGRVRGAPQPASMLVRKDVAAELERAKIRGIELIPVIVG